MPSLKLTLFQKGVQYLGSMIFNHLPPGIKDFSNNVKSFKAALNSFLLVANMFYTVDDFLREKTNDLVRYQFIVQTSRDYIAC
jgi:hypothetical protein